MSDNVIKFGKARKALARKTREAQAAENRIKHGMTKAQKQKLKTEKDKAAKNIDGHKLDNNHNLDNNK